MNEKKLEDAKIVRPSGMRVSSGIVMYCGIFTCTFLLEEIRMGIPETEFILCLRCDQHLEHCAVRTASLGPTDFKVTL